MKSSLPKRSSRQFLAWSHFKSVPKLAVGRSACSIVCFLMVLAGTVFDARAVQPPQMISYQGRITSGGTAYTGTGLFKFALVNAVGRSTQWSNDGTGSGGSQPTQSVALPVVNGLYSVRLGDTSIPGFTQRMPSYVFTDSSDVWLRVWFNDGTNGFQQLVPDQRIVSVGYALAAEKLTGQIAPANLPAGLITSSNLTANSIGTSSLADNAVTTPKLADATVTRAKIADGSITTSKLADESITASKLVPGSISSGIIAPNIGLWYHPDSSGIAYLGGGNVSVGAMQHDPIAQYGLHVEGADPDGNILVLGNTTPGSSTALKLGLNAYFGGKAFLQAAAGNGLSYGDLLLNPNLGKVAIGNNSPYTTLHVTGRGNNGSVLLLGGDPAVNSTTLLSLGMTADLNGDPFIQGVRSSGNTYGTLYLNKDGGAVQMGGGSGVVGINVTWNQSALNVRRPNGLTYGTTFEGPNGEAQVYVDSANYALEVYREAYKSNGNPFWNTTSDRRLKTDIHPLMSALETIDRVRPVGFHYNQDYRKKNPSVPDTEQFSVIAQEYAQVFPHFVTTNAEGYLNINSSPLVFFNTAAIQELHKEIQDRDIKIQDLEQRNARLEERLATRLSRIEKQLGLKGGSVASATDANE